MLQQHTTSCKSCQQPFPLGVPVSNVVHFTYSFRAVNRVPWQPYPDLIHNEDNHPMIMLYIRMKESDETTICIN